MISNDRIKLAQNINKIRESDVSYIKEKEECVNDEEKQDDEESDDDENEEEDKVIHKVEKYTEPQQ